MSIADTSTVSKSLENPKSIGPNAPLVREAWYVIDADNEIDRQIKSRTVVDQPLIYYRTEEGRVVVMDGRCPHRRYAMSEGTLEGDNVACGYHGLTFAPDGRCVFAPGCPNGVPKQIRIKIYDTVKAGPWIWVWMGLGKGDLEALPIPPSLQNLDWHTFWGCTPYECNYGVLHENLLDLSHVYYMHKVGTKDYADQPLNFLPDGRAGWIKAYPDAVNVYGFLTGAGWTEMVDMDERTEILGPGLMYTYADIKPTTEAAHIPSRGIVVQAVTPETSRKSTQFWMVGTDLPMAVTLEEYAAVVAEVYGQDQRGLKLQQAMIDGDTRTSGVEWSIPNDRASFIFRKKVAGMLEGKKFKD